MNESKVEDLEEVVVLTGLKSGRLKGALFQPKKNSSGVWNCSPMFKANCNRRRETFGTPEAFGC